MNVRIKGNILTLSEPIGKEIEGGLMIMSVSGMGREYTGLNTTVEATEYKIPAYVESEDIIDVYLKLSP